MQVLSSLEMQACDRLTSERFNLPSFDLMRAAAAAVATFVQEQFPGAQRIAILCGRGNNGGDGMIAAQLLASAGREVTVLLLGASDQLTGDAAEAWRQLIASGRVVAHVIVSPEQLAAHNPLLQSDLLIDAVVGTGFKPPLNGLALAACEWIRASKAPILAVDLPSGWAADETSATVSGRVFPADAVLTFTAPKPAHVFGQLTRHWDQPIAVAPIGSPDAAIHSELGVRWAGSSLALTQAPRSTGANKGNFGHVLVVGGSVGKSGAPSMTALAALRAGAGLVTAAVPSPTLALVASIAPELMTFPLLATRTGEIAAENLGSELLTPLTNHKTVLAVGPGLGQNPETVKFITGLLSNTKVPTVIDADALNILAAKPVVLSKLASSTVVLTPHPGEMARLAGIATSAVQSNRLEVAHSFARRSGVTVVLKGARTIIAHPDGSVAINTSGNPAMAKGGSGDMLTGLIAGLLAQHPNDPTRAIEAAVYLHGLAADHAVRLGDQHTLLATDSLTQFSSAFRYRFRGPNGYLWLQGRPAATRPATTSPEEAQ